MLFFSYVTIYLVPCQISFAVVQEHKYLFIIQYAGSYQYYFICIILDNLYIYLLCKVLY